VKEIMCLNNIINQLRELFKLYSMSSFLADASVQSTPQIHLFYRENLQLSAKNAKDKNDNS